MLLIVAQPRGYALTISIPRASLSQALLPYKARGSLAI